MSADYERDDEKNFGEVEVKTFKKKSIKIKIKVKLKVVNEFFYHTIYTY